MISAIYISASAILICWLSVNVIKKRRENSVSLGDGGNKDLIAAIAAQSNATEYIPIALLLLFALETNNANLWIIHSFGILLIAARIIHAQGILSVNLKRRVLGMQITFFSIISLAVLNLIYAPYA
ncbi:MAG: MAPEG family protein [Thiohalomonadales bacterium]